MFSTALSRLERKYKKGRKKTMLKLDNERMKLAAFIKLFVLPEDSKNWQID